MKKEISKIFAELRKFGWTVINNNTPSPQRHQQKAWVDYVLFNDKQIVFIEVKIGKDKLSEEQIDTMKKLKSIAEKSGRVHYQIVHDKSDAILITDSLLG